MRGVGLFIPVSAVERWRQIKLRDKRTQRLTPGFVVIGHNIGIGDALGQSFVELLGVTVVANICVRDGKTGWAFYQIPSTTLVLKDDE